MVDSRPIDVEVVVNHWNEAWGDLYVQEGEEPIYLKIDKEGPQPDSALRVGTPIRVQGIYVRQADQVQLKEITVLEGPERPASPHPIEAERLSLGQHWSRRIAMECTIESITQDGAACELVVQSKPMRLLVYMLRSIDPRQLPLIGARVRLTGTLSYLTDELGRPAVPKIYACEEDEFEILQKGVLIPATLSIKSVSEVVAGEAKEHFIRVQGIVSYTDDRELMVLSDDTKSALALRAVAPGVLFRGDRVSVIATRNKGVESSWLAALDPIWEHSRNPGADAEWLAKVIVKEFPSYLPTYEYQATGIVAAEIDLQRGRVEADLVSIESLGLDRTLRLTSDGLRFNAYVRATDSDPDFLKISDAKRVRVNGLIRSKNLLGPGPFEVEVASLDHIQVLPGGRLEIKTVGTAALFGLLIASGFVIAWLLFQLSRQSFRNAALGIQVSNALEASSAGQLLLDPKQGVLGSNEALVEILRAAGAREVSTSSLGGVGTGAMLVRLAKCFKDPDQFLAFAREALATASSSNATSSDRSIELNRAGESGDELRVSCMPISGGEGSTAQPNLLWTFADSKRDLRRESDLVQSQKMEAVGRLAGGIAHDFNNLLLAISANLELARMKHDELSSEEPQYLNAAEKAVVRASKLVKHLLGFSRKSNLERRALSPNTLVQRVQLLLERTLDTSLTLKISLDADVPNAKIDETHMEQVLLNLCLNARDACAGKGGLIEVSTFKVSPMNLEPSSRSALPGSAGNEDWICIRVKDNGVGMSSDVVSKVFDPFYTTKEQGKGTGLGLSVSLGVVEQHGGTIRLESTLGQGSTFDVLLPGTSDSSVGSDSVSGILSSAGRRVGKILIADDDDMVRCATSSALRAQGYMVIEAANGVDALIYLNAQDKFDLAILDLSMPGMTGTEVFTSLRESASKTPVILTSGYVTELETFARSLDPEPAGVLSKPYRLSKLVDIIDRILAKVSST
ncbi:MAG: ATP-binding protein [Pirellulaceae bacterium]